MARIHWHQTLKMDPGKIEFKRSRKEESHPQEANTTTNRIDGERFHYISHGMSLLHHNNASTTAAFIAHKFRASELGMISYKRVQRSSDTNILRVDWNQFKVNPNQFLSDKVVLSGKLREHMIPNNLK